MMLAPSDGVQTRKSADRADEDADWAIDYAYAAVEEAESAVLDAIYARQAADEDADWAIDYAYAAVEEAESAVLDPIYARMAADELVIT